MPPPPPPPPQATYQEPTPPPPPTPQYSYQPYNPDTNVNDFVNQMTGGIVPPQPQDLFDYEQDIDQQDESGYVEPEPPVKVIKSTAKKSSGRKGRPKKK